MKRLILTKLLPIILLLITCGAFTTPASANNTKLIALTFDDGPNAKITPQLLDALAERNVKVTFFLVGYTLEVNMDLAQRAHDEGHQLANHSDNHPWFSRLSAQGIQNEINAVNDMLAEITGETDFLLRAPYGDISSTLRELKAAPIIQWSVDPGNGNMNTAQYTMYANFVNAAKDGSIVILHDTSTKNVNVAVSAIDTLLERGYEFVTLDELFRLRGVSPEKGKVYYSVPPEDTETWYDESRLTEHWGWEHIASVQSAGVMVGDGEGFKPNGYMTRAMMAVTLARLEGIYNAEASPEELALYGTGGADAPYFTDVSPGSWYYEAVQWAAREGILLGVGEGRFEPDSYVTKEQFYTALSRVASEELTAAGGTAIPRSYRDDARISYWAAQGVGLFRQTGFFSKNDPEIFRPGDYLTRAEAAELLDWVMGLRLQSPDIENTGGYIEPLRFIFFVAGAAILLIHWAELMSTHPPEDGPQS